MDEMRYAEREIRIQHRHKDGSWAETAEVPSAHDPADRDYERAWANGRIFRCTTCPETYIVTPAGEGDPRDGG